MRLKASLADLRFSAFLLAQALGALNDNAFKTFVALLAVSTNPSAAPRIIALAGGLFVLPFLLFSAIAGDAADRWSKSQLMRIFKGAEIVLLLIAVPALVTANVPSLLVLMFLMGTHSAFFGPIKFAILPEIVEEADLSQANGLVQMTTFGGIILGTMLAAELAYVCHGHPAVAPVLLAVIALVGYGASLLVPETAPARPDVRLKVDIFSRTWGNVRHLTQFPTISLATYALSFFWFVGAIFQMNLIVYVTRQMGLGEMACGQFQTALALGIGLGSFVAGRLSRGKVELGLVPLGAIGIVAFSFDLAFAAASSGRVIGDLLLVGLSAGFFAVPLQALIQQRSPIDERGRVISTGNFLCFVAILGASGVLWILDVQWHLSPAKVFIACALFSALVAMELLRRLPDFFLRLMLYPIAHGLYSVRVKGQSHVPMEGPVLLVSNHVSFVDAILVAMANQRLVRFLLYRQFYELPIIHYLFRAMGCIPVSSGDGPKAMIESFQRARKAMMGGEAVCIFAEGGISRHGQMQRFKKGFERMVDGVDVPIIPVHLDSVWGSIFSFSEGKILFKWPRRIPYRVTVSFGRPLKSTATAFEVRQAILELGADAFSHRLSDSPPLPLVFSRQAKRRPFSLSLVDSSGLKLNAISSLSGAYLLGRTLGRVTEREERIGILLPPSVAGALTNFGLALSGKIPVNLNYTASKDIMDQCLAKAGIQTTVTSRKVVEKIGYEPAGKIIYLEDIAPTISTVQKASAVVLFLLTPSAILERTVLKTARGPLDRLATIMFTSGSTGIPKGVMLTHQNILSNIHAVAQVISLCPTDRLLGVLPFFHSFGLTVTLWLPACLGMGSIYHFTPLDWRQVGQLTHQYRATILLGTPTFLLAWMRRIEAEQFQTLRYVVVGAEKFREEVARAFQEKYGLVPLEGYGATELSPVASVNIPDIDWPGIKQMGTKLGTVGLPLPGVFMKIVDQNTGVELGPQEPGLLLVKGPNVMKGYLDDEAKTREVISNNYYVTGDVAKIDEDGFVTITDRLSRFSKVAGEMVPHIKVEEALHQALNLLDQTFIVSGVPDERRGERLVVLYQGDIHVEALIKKVLASDLPKLWIPDKSNFHQVAEFPLLGSGKIDFQKLKAEVARLERI